ncbi:MAG: hypothetical protein ACRECH_02880 [Nitrososphaerales archaeon]
MSIRVLPQPLHAANSSLIIAGLLILPALILGITVIVDLLGTAMFHRGFAKPFYLRGRRIHHSCIYLIIPGSYVILAGLFVLGYVQLIHNLFWVRLGYVGLLAAACISFDFICDRYWPAIRKNAILHHEWIYSIIPIYIFTNVINVII